MKEEKLPLEENKNNKSANIELSDEISRIIKFYNSIFERDVNE